MAAPLPHGVRRSRLALWLAAMAALKSIAAAAIMTEVLGHKWSGFLLALSGALDAGTGTWVAALRLVPYNSVHDRVP